MFYQHFLGFQCFLHLTYTSFQRFFRLYFHVHSVLLRADPTFSSELTQQEGRKKMVAIPLCVTNVIVQLLVFGGDLHLTSQCCGFS